MMPECAGPDRGSPGRWCSFQYKPLAVSLGQRVWVNVGMT